MLKLRFKFAAKCPKHPRYDPAKHGEAGIKGGCQRCQALVELFQYFRSLEVRARIAADYLNPRGWQSSRPPEAKR